MSSRFQPRAKICGAANRLRSSSRKRSKESIGTVRHPYLHFDIAQEVHPTSRRASDTVPTPTAFLSTSLGKYQILCRVDSFTFEQESTLKLLAILFGGDLACTDCDGVLHMPKFRNCKYDQPYSLTVTYPCDSTSNPGDCRLDIPAANAILLPHAIPSREHSDKHTNSEHDWAWILHELAHREDAAKLTRTLASRRSDKPRPLYQYPSGRPMSHRPDFAASKAFR
jgi:RepB DNA-primase from phage plasmid